ncbi:MAG: hypothetical protein ACR2P9_08045, partial [Gammaproteobacteria bacterium]
MQANILTTLKPFIRLLIASIFAIIITLLLLSFMHFLLGGFNSDDNYFTRLFTLKTVVLPKENTRPTKPARVRAQPDTTGPQEDNVKEET